jgi:hypothetical protein
MSPEVRFDNVTSVKELSAVTPGVLAPKFITPNAAPMLALFSAA